MNPLRIAAALAGMAAGALSQTVFGRRCPLCRDRTRNLSAHIYLDHAYAGGPR